MQWVKKGLIYGPDGSISWARHSALTPTPIQLEPGAIRVYAGFRDAMGVSRIGYVDVAADDPSNVLKVSSRPVLDIGRPGTFDDNGVILGDVLRIDDTVRMYYVGFQQVQKVKFLAFSGLAVSRDHGESFERLTGAPVLDRDGESLFIRAIHSVLVEDGVWKVWYASGSGWEMIGGVPYPRYHIHCTESPDGLSFHQPGRLCIDVENSEYRIGRPRVTKRDGIYQMYFTKGDIAGHYFPGYAESSDGTHWVRKDDQIGLTLSASGWDSRTLCYPALITVHGRTYMFYNGNDMGKDGFGYAEAMP
ncbi:MAG: hypothetical protein MUC57_15185 [Desulfobacterales bacterium]|jgi:hypothetical protein|nr:hypothetical protein [Desulfobacterales bacterium]